MFKRRHIYLLAIIPIALSFPVQGLAAGKITIKPKVSTSWQSDSNFYKAETIERDVYTYLVQPGIELGYETPKSQVLLNYTLDSYYYDDKGTVPSGQKPADKEDYTGHTGVFSARARPFVRLTLGLDNSYYKTRDPAQSDRLSNAIGRDKYFINRLTPLVLYKFGPKFSAGLRYRNTETDYDIGTREDSTENRGIFDLVYNLTRLTSLDLEYQNWKRDYDLTTSDYTSDQIKLIFRKQFKYFSFKVGGGSQNRDFDDPTMEDIDMFTYSIALAGQNPPAPEPRPKSHITFAVEQNFNDSGTGEAYFKAHRFSLDAGHLFEEKLLAGIEGYYQISDYETAPREDKTYDISGNLGYLFTNWLTLSITVGFEKRNSNLAGYDYDNGYYMVKLDFSY